MVDQEIFRHKEWLGFLQPVGLVVSPPALVKAQAVVNRNVIDRQQALQEIICEGDSQTNGRSWISDFSAFAVEVLEWERDDLESDAKRLMELEVVLPEYGEVLTPTYAVSDPAGDGWLMLVQVIPPGSDFDEVEPAVTQSATRWHATPQAKFERLLREKEIPIGLLNNGTDLRLVYAPRGESSGHLTFPIQAICEVSGRLILGAMLMLLSADRIFNMPSDRTLSALLRESRKYQAEVSTKLSEQVLDALWELLRGFQTANEASGNRLLGEIAKEDPQHIYGGLITTLLRLVFLLYAEDEGLMSQSGIYTRNYSVTGLYQRLREDAGNYPDTMDQRYGAWAWLLSLFRLVYDGGGHDDLYLPARHGQLFDPNEYPFLESRPRNTNYQDFDRIEPPRVSDGIIYRVLQGLLILDGDRLSYRSLDVEQIGSVYEAVMGYEVEQAQNPSIGVWSKPKTSKVSVTVVVSIEEILKTKANDRAKYLKEVAGCEISGNSLKDLKEAKTVDDVVAALGKKVSGQTPTLMPAGSLYLQPGEERRRSGSHYTPRAMTEPIVRETLRPVFAALGENPTPEQILALKICDLAMGSGAFLVETCRQLAEKLVETWNQHNSLPEIPPDEYPLLYARRLVAQRCLYGVDKNPFATNLAKLSLWLVTLAKEHSFTFLDHALKCGDSLVGLTRAEIGEFVKATDIYNQPLLSLLKDQVEKARIYRDEIGQLADDQDAEKWQRFQKAEAELQSARLTGNMAIAAFFAAEKDKERKEKRIEFSQKVNDWRSGVVNTEQVERIAQSLQQLEKPIQPFNWDIEFPEVFERKNPGFDAIIGNPPFLGGKKISTNFGNSYLAWLLEVNLESNGNADIVAHFFRRAFAILRKGGCLGLIATNTIAQGDTRTTGLRYICQNGGTIYKATKRFKWIGLAAVVVSIVHFIKESYKEIKFLDNKEVSLISAFLFHAGGNENPKPLLANADKSFQGSIVLGMGFTFDDTNPDATPIAEMHRLIEQNPKNAERIFPYIGGEEVNSSPTHAHDRYVINFGEMSEAEAKKYPDLYTIIQEKVYPERKNKPGSYSRQWWLFGRRNQEGNKAIINCNRVLVTNCGASKHISFSFQPSQMVFANTLDVFAFETYSAFCSLQSRIHETWARFFGSSMKDDLRYTPTDCFETFPFPLNWETNPTLEEIGKTYYEYRADLMVGNNQGLTTTYNRFHNPEERDLDILKLRELHAEMDRAVLDAYGWTDIPTGCEFLLDYEEEDEEEDSSKRQKKKPWRYRWPEEVHDEVLARLLDLNQKRYEEEILGGKHAETKSKAKKTKAKSKKSSPSSTPTIPGLEL
ncbi:Eco57I restriction-modification methylase domain-containing protein [Microcoleus sp. FACHB-672]|uniref:Eco57I restriction-modification methylase domain-containing protein n=1 Tax=Microcoleus sp. FACHB-672 TaxID=2692825 RepID=UPI0016871F47|nr:DNA methyltransferase [Microcoleus sp. FACHB-672]MBD2039086.1 N-6 DNA methylase [Microcoleus sp. FACHB-672]